MYKHVLSVVFPADIIALRKLPFFIKKMAEV